ncbi:MAG: site-specific integrase, partial [Nostoc sp.]
ESGRTYSRTRVIVRKKSTVNDDLQAFLSLAFMLLIPTDRARTYYELEIGETFVCGLLQNNKFIPLGKLKDKTQATWYIHLMPGNYKTGKIYKEYWGIMPNVEFEDGKKLYEYIDKWINEGRECQQKCNHNLFFRGTESYKPLKVNDWCSRIKTPFESLTGVPVTPKEIRKMYITHLNNSGATNAQLKGAAYAMHHSQRMQESVYNSQTVLDRIAPIYELNERIWKEVITPPSRQMIAA